MPLTELTGSPELLEVHRQASRYFNAVHGPDWVFKAPEQWANLVERWIWALAAGDLVFADEVMARLEDMAADAKAGP